MNTLELETFINSKPIFIVRERSNGHEYRIWVDGRVEGFPNDCDISNGVATVVGTMLCLNYQLEVSKEQQSPLFQNIWARLFPLPDNIVLHCYCEMIYRYWSPCLGPKPEWWVDGQAQDRQREYARAVLTFVHESLGQREMQRYMFVRYYQVCSDEQFTAYWKAGCSSHLFPGHGIECRRPSGIS